MATFKVDSKALMALEAKFKNAATNYKNYAILEINKAVKAMEVEATAKAGNLPLLPSTAKKRYERTGNLSRSISSTPYKDGHALFSMGNNQVNYGPYVEFGTGKGYKLPKYSFTLKKPLTNFAAQYKGNNLKNYNMPARPFFFKTFDEKFSILLKSLKRYKVD